MNLSRVSTADLERLLSALAGRRLSFPLSRFGLQGEGLELLADEALGLNAIGREGALAVLGAVIAERRERSPHPELVWTGPESRWSGARDTAVVLADLFRGARTTILLAGFAFDHAASVPRPLHESLQRGVSCRLFTDRGQTRNVEVGVLLEDVRLAAVLEAQFVAGEWFTRVP